MARRAETLSFDSAGGPVPVGLGVSDSFEILRENIAATPGGEDYPSGVLRGLRADFAVMPNWGTFSYPPGYAVYVVPRSTPTLSPVVPGTTAWRTYQSFLWASGLLQPVFVGSTLTATVCMERVAPKTARRFNQGEDVVFLVFNPNPTQTFGAAACAYVSGSVRVFPDRD